MTPSQDTVRATILALAERYLSSGEAPSLYEINNGQCEDLAIEALGGDRDGVEFWDAYNLTMEGNGFAWDVDLIERLWPACVPTHGLDWDDVRMDVPAHCWLVVDDRHYDAECPDGTENMFELPILRRMMERTSGQPSLDDAAPLPSP
jgi:hypothetical protein